MWQNWWVQRYRVFVSLPNFTLRKAEGCLDSVVEKAIMKMQKKAQRHTRGLAAQFIDFLQALEYQHINYTLEWYLLRCFYPRIRNFRKKFWKRRERLFQNNVCPDKKKAHYFSKTRQKIFVKLHWQTWHVFNKFLKIMWKHDKRMKIELHISKCWLQHSAPLWFYCKWANVASLFLP